MKEKILLVRERMARASATSGRSLDDITLIAVSKTVGEAEIRQAALMGISDFGENRTRDLVLKQQSFPDLRWHMIGRLQTNKVKEIIGRAILIHSLDRWNLAEEIDHRARAMNITVDALLQVNIAGEEQKGGLPPNDMEAFLDAAGQLSSLRIKGMMTIAPEVDNQEKTRPIFRELYQMQQKFRNRKWTNVDLKCLSMGMSQDFEVAIEEGADLVRIGSAIFN
ncbi:MAG: YggS family pyridoxal phosphate-dependent enzyme [Syntrophomonas sp.]